MRYVPFKSSVASDGFYRVADRFRAIVFGNIPGCTKWCVKAQRSIPFETGACLFTQYRDVAIKLTNGP